MRLRCVDIRVVCREDAQCTPACAHDGGSGRGRAALRGDGLAKDTEDRHILNTRGNNITQVKRMKEIRDATEPVWGIARLES